MKKIAIIEDDSILSALYKHVLGPKPLECFYYHDYHEASQAFKGGLKPDLILLDVQLSDREHNGVDLASVVRSMGINVPILFITSSSDEWIEKHLLQNIKNLEPCECLHKPFKVEQFERLLDSFLTELPIVSEAKEKA